MTVDSNTYTMSIPATDPGNELEASLAGLDMETPPKTLLEIPAELRLSILNFIKAPSDLKSLCLTCKALNGPATARLYRKVTLTADSLTKDLAKSFND